MKKLFFSNTPLLVSLFVAMTIAATEAPLWIVAFSASMIFWKFLNEYLKIPKLAPVLTPLLGISIFLIVYIQNKTVFGQEESTTILLGLTALAILNYQYERDILFLVLLGFLMLVTKAIFSIDLIWVLPSFFSFFGLWFTLLENFGVNRFRYVLRTTLMSLPMFFLLFIFFPRFVIFQSSKVARTSAQSGFSEDLAPGNFSSLVLQNDLVFRAEFAADYKPKIEYLYWRGAVLDISNGFTWQKGKSEKISRTQESKLARGQFFHIIQEPLNLKNIFALENSQSLISNVASILKSDSGIYTLAEIQPVPFQFTGNYTLENQEVSALELMNLKVYLKYPLLPEKTAAWVEKTKQKFAGSSDRLQALESFFAKSGFLYTLSPGNYKNNLDDFLFSRKRGFCEHFAAAFATLARALDIPARVVIGYQGGVYNSVGHFWKISQKDAHAWVEVVQENHWQRVDPTAQVSPLRIALGGDAYFSLPEDEQILYSKNSSWKGSDSNVAILNQMANFFENLNYHWTLFLLDYDLQAQLEFLKTISFSGVAVFIFLALVIIFIFSYRQRRAELADEKINPLSAVLAKIELWAADKKIMLVESMTPLQFLKVIANQFPQTNTFLTEFRQEYTAVIYQSRPPTTNSKSWEKKWSQLVSQITSNQISLK